MILSDDIDDYDDYDDYDECSHFQCFVFKSWMKIKRKVDHTLMRMSDKQNDTDDYDEDREDKRLRNILSANWVGNLFKSASYLDSKDVHLAKPCLW